jgi:hypothetical protein
MAAAMLRSPASFCGASIRMYRTQFMLNASETFMQPVTLIQWTEHTVKAFKAASKLQHKLVWSNGRRDLRSTRRGGAS